MFEGTETTVVIRNLGKNGEGQTRMQIIGPGDSVSQEFLQAVFAERVSPVRRLSEDSCIVDLNFVRSRPLEAAR
jgi:hypothetical protein